MFSSFSLSALHLHRACVIYKIHMLWNKELSNTLVLAAWQLSACRDYVYGTHWTYLMSSFSTCLCLISTTATVIKSHSSNVSPSLIQTSSRSRHVLSSDRATCVCQCQTDLAIVKSERHLTASNMLALENAGRSNMGYVTFIVFYSTSFAK